MDSAAAPVLLDVSVLNTSIDTPEGTVRPVHDVSFQVARGSTLGLVGESGSGKSMLLKSVLGIQPRAATVTGRVVFDGIDLVSLKRSERNRLIGRRVGVVYQNPMTSLNPVVRVGRQIGEASRVHLGLSRAQAQARSIDLLEQVGIPEPQRRYLDYPHQFSGGMRQRIVIAMALACEPDLLIADEATTALDVTVQREILDLLTVIQAERGMTMIIVSHDLAVVASRTDRVMVMYGGRKVESANTADLFAEPQHRYTEALLGAMPRIDQDPRADLLTIPGRPPRLVGTTPGCPFADRCRYADDSCTESMPPESHARDASHVFHCFHPPQPTAVAPQDQKAAIR